MKKIDKLYVANIILIGLAIILYLTFNTTILLATLNIMLIESTFNTSIISGMVISACGLSALIYVFASIINYVCYKKELNKVLLIIAIIFSIIVLYYGWKNFSSFFI